MYKGERLLCFVLLGLFVFPIIMLIGLAPVSASTVLTETDETVVRGGCGTGTLYCNQLVCHAGYPSDCNYTLSFICITDNPDYDCNETYINPQQWVHRCLNGTNQYGPCSQGPLTGCGMKHACHCINVELGYGLCVSTEDTYNRHYYPCE